MTTTNRLDMESRSKNYRERADQCVQASKEVLGTSIKSRYLDLAKQWVDLARVAESEAQWAKRNV